jgi:hypothetical protein
MLVFYGEKSLAYRTTSKLEDHPFSAVCDCLFNIFAATLQIWRPSPPSATDDEPCRGDREPHNILENIQSKNRHNIYTLRLTIKSRDSSVGIAMGYGLDDRGSRVRFPSGTGNFSLHHRVQNGSGVYRASCPMGTRGSFPGGKAAGA